MYLTRLASLHRVGAEASVLVNALSGAVDLVDNELRGKLLGLAMGVEPTLSEEVRRALAERRYLLDSEREERAALAQLYQAYRALAETRPLQLVLALTRVPDLLCAHGAGDAEAAPQAGVMTAQHVRDAFAAIPSLAPTRPSRILHVALCGDPSLLPAATPVLSEALARAEEAGLVVQTVTAGDLLPHLISLLTRHRPAVRAAQVTVTAPASDGVASWEHVVRPVEQCLEVGLEVSLRVNIGVSDLSSLPALLEVAAARGWARPRFSCQVALAAGRGSGEATAMRREDQLVAPVLALWRAHPELRQQFDFQLFRALHHLVAAVEGAEDTASLPRFQNCDVDRGEVWTFAPDGLLYLCPEAIGNRRGVIGSYSPRYRLRPRRVARWANRSVLSLPECRDCNIATFCGGGCAYAALRRFGGPTHGFCGGTPEVLKAYFRHLPERLQVGRLGLAAPPEAQ